MKTQTLKKFINSYNLEIQLWLLLCCSLLPTETIPLPLHIYW